MNNQEVTMHYSLPSNTLKAYSKVIEAAGLTLEIMRSVRGPFKPLASQAIRAASSVAANLSEGQGRRGKDRVHFYRIAYGSAMEVDTFLRLLNIAGAIDSSAAQKAADLFDEARAMTWKLIHKNE